MKDTNGSEKYPLLMLPWFGFCQGLGINFILGSGGGLSIQMRSRHNASKTKHSTSGSSHLTSRAEMTSLKRDLHAPHLTCTKRTVRTQLNYDYKATQTVTIQIKDPRLLGRIFVWNRL